MGRGGSSAGRGGGGSLKANATGGTVRQIAGRKVNTADVVNQAIRSAKVGPRDLEKARKSLGYLGHQNPSPDLIRRYATESVVLTNISRLTGSSARDQVGKWDFTNANTILKSFNSYLDRRIGGQHARWSSRNKR